MNNNLFKSISEGVIYIRIDIRVWKISQVMLCYVYRYVLAYIFFYYFIEQLGVGQRRDGLKHVQIVERENTIACAIQSTRIVRSHCWIGSRTAASPPASSPIRTLAASADSCMWPRMADEETLWAPRPRLYTRKIHTLCTI